MGATKTMVITGGPGTGKTALIITLQKRGYICLPEVSRQITLEAQHAGIDQLFLKDALSFSQKILEGRIHQYHQARNDYEGSIFIDRGIPDVIAYMDYAKADYPDSFVEACEKYHYDKVFLLPPWKDIYVSDNERYEDFKQAVEIHHYLEKTYKKYGYCFTEVPTGTLDLRADFIVNAIS